MQNIYNNDERVEFKLAPNDNSHLAVVKDVEVERRVIGEAVTTNIYYDLDIFYNKEQGLHAEIKHIHSAFVHPHIEPH